VFDEVTRRRSGGNAARRAGFVAGSTALQVALAAAIVAVSAAVRAKVVEPQQVEVKFLKALSPAPPPPPPPPAPTTRVERKKPERPKTPPQPLFQPPETHPEVKEEPPEPPEPEEPDAGSDAGVVGGVTGGAAGGVVGGVPGVAGAEEVPAYATAGFRKPRTAEAGCVQRSLRVPEEWMDRLGLVTVKFAIGVDGVPGRFQSMTGGFAERVAPAIWRAVRSCRWIPGADAQGRPTAIWVILPIRFTLE
jgi:protein TonB